MPCWEHRGALDALCLGAAVPAGDCARRCQGEAAAHQGLCSGSTRPAWAQSTALPGTLLKDSGVFPFFPHCCSDKRLHSS